MRNSVIMKNSDSTADGKIFRLQILSFSVDIDKDHQ